mgnify:CR=1 FL=1
MVLKTEYLVDERGEKKSVVLSLQDYLRLMEYLQDLEDSVDLKKAKESARGFKEFNKVVHRLKLQGRLR